MSFDRAALLALLDPNKERRDLTIRTLTKAAGDWVHGTFACPDCGDEEPKDHNVEPFGSRTYGCTSCGCQFTISPTTVDP